MAFGRLERSAGPQPMSDITMTPRIDVMLVLLVIFIVTAPLLTHSVKIDLPKASSSPNITRPEHVQLGIREDGSLHWNGAAVALEELESHFSAAAMQEPQPELHIRADRLVPYERVAQVMSKAAKAGLVRIGFVTDPSQR
jgi:biopolymer transport protein ExbD